jgi:hypothetical protein
MTEYELSADFVFWGDALDWKRLADDLQLTLRLSRTKGDPLKRPDGTDTGSVAKTGILSCECSARGSGLRRDPEAQLLAALGALKRLAGSLEVTYGVSEAEFQMNIYYGDKTSGEPDFMIPPELLKILVQHGIDLRVTALP